MLTAQVANAEVVGKVLLPNFSRNSGQKQVKEASPRFEFMPHLSSRRARVVETNPCAIVRFAAMYAWQLLCS